MTLEEALNILGPELVKQLRLRLVAFRVEKAAHGEYTRPYKQTGPYDFEKDLDKGFEVKSTTEGSFQLVLKLPRHFENIQKGRRKKLTPPPIEPIQQWIGKKGIQFDKLSQRSMAFAISRSIGTKGIYPYGNPTSDILKEAMKQAMAVDNGVIVEGSKDEIQKQVNALLLAFKTELNK